MSFNQHQQTLQLQFSATFNNKSYYVNILVFIIHLEATQQFNYKTCVTVLNNTQNASEDIL